jgi:hypothetical protein
MKSDHRHELKTNELAEWLVNFPQWAKENHKTIIGIIVLIISIACFFTWKFYKNTATEREQLEFTSLLNSISDAKMQVVNAHMQGSDVSYLLLQRAGDLKTFSEKASNDNIAAISIIKQADSLRAELHYRNGEINKQTIIDQINQAKAAYTKAIELTSSNYVLRAIATFGLGLCAEELSNFKEARQIYQNIVDNPDFKGTTTLVQVQQRLKIMSDYERDIVLLPAPIPEPNIAMEPQILPFDSDLPFDVNFSVEANSPADTNLPEDVNIPTEVNVPLEVNFPADANSKSQTTGSNSIEILPISNKDILSLSTDDVRQIMEKAGFSSEQISQYETEVRDALEQTGAVQIKKGNAQEAVLAVRDKEVYVSTRQRDYFIYNVNEGNFIGASTGTTTQDIKLNDIPKDSDVNVPVE